MEMFKNGVLRFAAAFVVAGLAAFALAGCSSSGMNASDSGKQQGAEASVQATWSPDADCAGCHASALEDGCLAAIHVNGAGASCATCHSDSDKLAAVHAEVTEESVAPKKLKKTAVDESACTLCHDVATLAETTTACTVLTDSEGTVVNPHDVPTIEDHAQVTCTSCHAMHDVEADVAKDAPKVCLTCHHQNVYTCGTCH